MGRRHKHIFFLLLLMTGFHIGNHFKLYASSLPANSPNDIVSLFTTGTNNNIVTEVHYKIGDSKQVFGEIGEEISEEEEEKTIRRAASIAVSHTYYSSGLRYLTSFFVNKVNFFDTSSLVSTTPIYIRNEVFRL